MTDINNPSGNIELDLEMYDFNQYVNKTIYGPTAIISYLTLIVGIALAATQLTPLYFITLVPILIYNPVIILQRIINIQKKLIDIQQDKIRKLEKQ